MLIAVQFEVKDQTRILDILKPKERDFSFFTSGTLEFILNMIGDNYKGCSKCGNSVDNTKNKERWIIFSLDDKMESFKLLQTLSSNLAVKVQTLQKMSEFTDRNQIVCENCREPLKRKGQAPSLLINKKEKAQFAVSEEEKRNKLQDILPIYKKEPSPEVQIVGFVFNNPSQKRSSVVKNQTSNGKIEEKPSNPSESKGEMPPPIPPRRYLKNTKSSEVTTTTATEEKNINLTEKSAKEANNKLDNVVQTETSSTVSPIIQKMQPRAMEISSNKQNDKMNKAGTDNLAIIPPIRKHLKPPNNKIKMPTVHSYQERTEIFYKIKAIMQEKVKQLRASLNIPEQNAQHQLHESAENTAQKMDCENSGENSENQQTNYNNKVKLNLPEAEIGELDPNIVHKCQICNVVLKVKETWSMHKSIKDHVGCHLDYIPSDPSYDEYCNEKAKECFPYLNKLKEKKLN